MGLTNTKCGDYFGVCELTNWEHTLTRGRPWASPNTHKLFEKSLTKTLTFYVSLLETRLARFFFC